MEAWEDLNDMNGVLSVVYSEREQIPQVFKKGYKICAADISWKNLRN